MFVRLYTAKCIHFKEPSVCVFSYVADEDVRLGEEVTDEKRNAGKERGGFGGTTGSVLSQETHPLSHTYTHTV